MLAKCRWSLVLAVGLGALGAGVNTPLAAAPARVSEADFSYVPPPGWKVAPFPGLKNHIVYTHPLDGLPPNVNFVNEYANIPLAQYSQVSIQQLNLHFPGFHLQSQAPFTTNAGLRGVKITVQSKPQGKVLRQVFFLLPGRGPIKYVITASTLASDGAKYDGVVNAMIKTFTVK